MQITSRATLAQDCREIALLFGDCLAFAVFTVVTVFFVIFI